MQFGSKGIELCELELKNGKTDNFDVVTCGTSHWPVNCENSQPDGSL